MYVNYKHWWISENENSAGTQSAKKLVESEAENGTTKTENDRDTNATNEQSQDRMEHDEFKEYVNWYVRYNIAQREKCYLKYNFILGEYQAEATKRKRLEVALESNDDKIANLMHQHERLKKDCEEAVAHKNVMSQMYSDLLEETKHHKSSKKCFVKHCKHAPTARFKSLSFCSFECANKTFTVKAIDLQII